MCPNKAPYEAPSLWGIAIATEKCMYYHIQSCFFQICSLVAVSCEDVDHPEFSLMVGNSEDTTQQTLQHAFNQATAQPQQGSGREEGGEGNGGRTGGGREEATLLHSLPPFFGVLGVVLAYLSPGSRDRGREERWRGEVERREEREGRIA